MIGWGRQSGRVWGGLVVCGVFGVFLDGLDITFFIFAVHIFPFSFSFLLCPSLLPCEQLLQKGVLIWLYYRAQPLSSNFASSLVLIWLFWILVSRYQCSSVSRHAFPGRWLQYLLYTFFFLFSIFCVSHSFLHCIVSILLNLYIQHLLHFPLLSITSHWIQHGSKTFTKTVGENKGRKKEVMPFASGSDIYANTIYQIVYIFQIPYLSSPYLSLSLSTHPINNPTSLTTARGTPPRCQLLCTHFGIHPPASDVVAVRHSTFRCVVEGSPSVSVGGRSVTFSTLA